MLSPDWFGDASLSVGLLPEKAQAGRFIFVAAFGMAWIAISTREKGDS